MGYWISNLKDKEYKEYSFVTVFTTAVSFGATLSGLAVLIVGISNGNDNYIASGSVLISVFIAFFIQMASSLDNAVVQKKTEKKFDDILEKLDTLPKSNSISINKTEDITDKMDISISFNNRYQLTNKDIARLGATILVGALLWRKIKKK